MRLYHRFDERQIYLQYTKAEKNRKKNRKNVTVSILLDLKEMKKEIYLFELSDVELCAVCRKSVKNILININGMVFVLARDTRSFPIAIGSLECFRFVFWI